MEMVFYAPQRRMNVVSEKPSIVAYLGPDTLLPLGSALAGLLGMGLLFGRRAALLGQKALRKLSGKPPEDPQDEQDTDGPESESNSAN